MTMKRHLPLFFCFLFTVAAFIQPGSTIAQDQKEFVFTIYGGLFFPSNPHYSDLYQSSSDAIWGVGVGLPLSHTLFVTADYSFFRPETFPYAVPDSSTKLNEKFLHLGLLSRQPLAGAIFLRLSGGISFTSITQTTSGPHGSDRSLDADNALGYYGGAGIEEQVGDGHIAIFSDVLYDYRRSRGQGLSGDFGGVRAVLGAHLIFF